MTNPPVPKESSRPSADGHQLWRPVHRIPTKCHCFGRAGFECPGTCCAKTSIGSGFAATTTTSRISRRSIADEWRSRLRRQEESLDGTRKRAGQALAASLVIAGLFTVGASDPSWWQLPFKILAVWSLVSLVGIVAFIEWPRTWEFNQDTDDVVKLVRASGLQAPHRPVVVQGR